MKKKGYYSSGEFARMAHVTLRTVRYYDKHNILKPSLVTDSGSRFYTDQEFAKLQQILLLKYIGFTLDEIRELTIGEPDVHFMLNSLNIQLKLIQDKIEQMQSVEHAIKDTAEALQNEEHIDWAQMLKLIHLTGMENTLKKQYQNASNISARINLHQLYSENQQGWFRWVFAQSSICSSSQILELGCGDGTLWLDNYELLSDDITVTLSDVSEGMLRDARRAIGTNDSRFRFEVFDCENIPYDDESFDYVIANHVLFYCQNIPRACHEISRVLKPGGIFLCSTYGKNHMKQVSELVSEFDERIVLSANTLYENFGRQNGCKILKGYFTQCLWKDYIDSLNVTEHEPLISYILSCHGNQKQYILDHYNEFRSFVKKKTKKGFYITKEAGIFLCQK